MALAVFDARLQKFCSISDTMFFMAKNTVPVVPVTLSLQPFPG